MPRKTTKRICTLLIGVAAMLLFATTARAQSCPPPPPPMCVLSNPNASMPAYAACPSTVKATSTWGLITNAAAGCVFSCAMFTHDSSFTNPLCMSVAAFLGPLPVSVGSNLTVTFSATDNNPHYLQILTTVVDQNGTRRTYNSPTVGTQCSN
jgi:hypothetical protein